MANPWFRMYSEFSTDPKVQMLSESNQRRLVMLLCLRCNGNVTLHDDEVAFQLRISNDEWSATKSLFIEKKFINEHIEILNWDKRQFSSDSSKNRVAAFRERKNIEKTGDYKNKPDGNDDVTLHVTNSNAVDTDTDTDTDTEKAAAATHKKLKSKSTPKNFETTALIALGIDLVLIQDFLKIRKTKLTETAINAIVRESGLAGITPSDAVRICIERGWQSFNSGWGWNQQAVNQTAPVNGKSGFTKQVINRPIYSYPGEIGDAIDSTSSEIIYEQAKL